MKPISEKARNEQLEEENRRLTKEMEILHGRLGAQGAAVAREGKYHALNVELKQMYHELEKALEGKKTLRDNFAAKAMQGLLSCDRVHEVKEMSFDELLYQAAKKSYVMADAMLAARVEGVK